MAKYLIIDENLKLALPQLSYTAELHQLILKNKAHLTLWLNWVPTIQSEKDTERFLRNAQMFNQGKTQLNTLILEQDKIIGSISFVRIQKEHQTGEIGYWLDNQKEGQGIITKACKTLINYGFSSLKLNRIQFRIARGNLKSKRVAQRLSFIYEGTLREAHLVNHSFLDMEIYSILKKEWKNKNK